MPAAGSSFDEQIDRIVGRERELLSLGKFLSRSDAAAAPALIVVAGPNGMGKSTLLERLRQLAVGRAWHVVPGPSKELAVTPATTEHTFHEAMCELLGVDARPTRTDSLTAEAPPAASSRPSDGTALSPLLTQARAFRSGSGSLAKLVQALVPAVRSLADLRQEWEARSPSAPSNPSQGVRHPLVEHLTAAAPVVLLVDGYRANKEFGQWFVDVFVQDVLRTSAPIVLVVADQSPNLTALKRVAAQSAGLAISLGPLSRRALRAHFQTVGRTLQPPMTAPERDHYVEASRDRPHLVRRFTHVLQLARVDEG